MLTRSRMLSGTKASERGCELLSNFNVCMCCALMVLHEAENDVESAFGVFWRPSVVVLVVRLFLCFSSGPVKTQHFVPQTNMSALDSQNNTRRNRFYICKCCRQCSVSQGFPTCFYHQGHLEMLGKTEKNGVSILHWNAEKSHPVGNKTKRLLI